MTADRPTKINLTEKGTKMEEKSSKTPEENEKNIPEKQALNKEPEKSADYQAAFRKTEYYYKAAAVLNAIAITVAIWLGRWWWLLAIIVFLSCIGILFYVICRMRKKYLALSEQEQKKYRQESQKYQQERQKDIQKHQEHIQTLESKDTKIFLPSALKKIIYLIISVGVVIAAVLTMIYIDDLRFSYFIEMPVATESGGSVVLLLPALWVIVVIIAILLAFLILDIIRSKSNSFICLFLLVVVLPYIGKNIWPTIKPIIEEELFKTKLAKTIMSRAGKEVQNIKLTAPLIYEVKLKNGKVFRVVLNDKKNRILMADRRFIPDPKEHKALIQVLQQNHIPQDLFYEKVKDSDKGSLLDDKKSDKRLFKNMVFYYYEGDEEKAFIVRQKPNGKIYLVFPKQESNKISAKNNSTEQKEQNNDCREKFGE